MNNTSIKLFLKKNERGHRYRYSRHFKDSKGNIMSSNYINKLKDIHKIVKFPERYKLPKSLKKKLKGLPWWFSGWESACQCRGHGFDPWSGRFPHVVEQLSPMCHNYWASTLEPVSHNYWVPVLQLLKPTAPTAHALQQEKLPQWEAHAPQRRTAPTCSKLKKAQEQQQRPSTAKNK